MVRQKYLLNWHYNELQRLQDLNEIILEKDSIVQGLQDEVRFRAPHNSQDETFLRWLNWQAKRAKCSRAVFIRFHLVFDNKLCQYSLPGSADWCSIFDSCWTQQPHDTSGLWMRYESVFQWQTEYCWGLSNLFMKYESVFQRQKTNRIFVRTHC